MYNQQDIRSNCCDADIPEDSIDIDSVDGIYPETQDIVGSATCPECGRYGRVC